MFGWISKAGNSLLRRKLIEQNSSGSAPVRSPRSILARCQPQMSQRRMSKSSSRCRAVVGAAGPQGSHNLTGLT